MPRKRATKSDLRPPRTVSYLRVSTDGEDTETDKADILNLPMIGNLATSSLWRTRAYRARHLGNSAKSAP